MYIEEIIDRLVGMGSWGHGGLQPGSYSFIGSYDSNILHSFDSQICKNLGLTEKQAVLAEKILKKYSTQISNYFGKSIQPYLDTPQYKFPKRIVPQSKTIKITEGGKFKKIISVKFPYDEVLINKIKDYKKEHQTLFWPFPMFSIDTIFWDIDNKVWNFYFLEEHIDWIGNNLENLGFDIDEEFTRIFEEIQKIKNNIEDYIPMVIFKDNKFSYLNSHKNIPQPTSTDLITVLFEAKKYGITTWDENIDQAVDSINPSNITKQILTENNTTQFILDYKKYDFTDINEIIHQSTHCLFVIPGGSELETLKFSYKFLTNQGYTPEQISVLFRLDSSAGKMCNDFVKDQNINNPISKNIKIFFVSGKMPKPLISANIKFDVIINLGSNSVHYTLKNFIKTHNLVINYTIEKQKKEQYLGDL